MIAMMATILTMMFHANTVSGMVQFIHEMGVTATAEATSKHSGEISASTCDTLRGGEKVYGMGFFSSPIL